MVEKKSFIDVIGLSKKIAERSLSSSPTSKNYKTMMGNEFKLIKNPEFVPDLMEMKKQNTIFLLKMEKKALKKKIKEKK